jgi:hypothetical protein
MTQENYKIKVGDKLAFNRGGDSPSEIGTVEVIVPESKTGGAFVSVCFSRKYDGAGNSFAKMDTADIGDIILSPEDGAGIYLVERKEDK